MTTTYTDSRIINVASISSDQQNNGSLKSDVFFIFQGLLKEEDDILHTQISVDNAQFPVSYYTINEYNNILSYTYNGNPFTVIFDMGNYNANSFASEFASKVPHITITLNKINGKFTFSSNQNFSLFFATSTCFIVLGLDPNTDYINTTHPHTIAAPFLANFAGIKRIKIQSDTLSTYSRDSNGIGNCLAVIPVSTASFGIINYQNITNYKPLLRERVLDGFDIRLFDEYNNLIDFNGVDWNVTLKIDITRKYKEMDRTFPNFSNLINALENINPGSDKKDDPQDEAQDEPQDPLANNTEELPLSTGDSDLDFFLYQKGINI
jgi:hypothetical protein